MIAIEAMLFKANCTICILIKRTQDSQRWNFQKVKSLSTNGLINFVGAHEIREKNF